MTVDCIGRRRSSFRPSYFQGSSHSLCDAAILLTLVAKQWHSVHHSSLATIICCVTAKEIARTFASQHAAVFFRPWLSKPCCLRSAVRYPRTPRPNNYNGVNLLPNTTIWWRDIYYLLHREQLHVSALDNGHLQVVHESLSKQLYKHIYMSYLYGEGGVGGVVKWVRDLVSVRTVGTHTRPNRSDRYEISCPFYHPPPIYIYIYVYITAY